jgi:hypothetical protein
MHADPELLERREERPHPRHGRPVSIRTQAVERGSAPAAETGEKQRRDRSPLAKDFSDEAIALVALLLLAWTPAG